MEQNNFPTVTVSKNDVTVNEKVDQNQQDFPEIEKVYSKPKKRPFAITCLIGIIIAFSLILLLVAVFHKHNQIIRIFARIQTKLSVLYMDKPWLVFLIVFATINFVIISNIGFQMILSIIFCLVIRNYFYSFLILTISNLTAETIIYFTAEKYMCCCFINRIKKSAFFKLLQEEAKSKPYRVAFLTRFLFMSNGLKNIVLCLLRVSVGSYFLSASIANFISNNLAFLISLEINQIGDLHSKNHKWADKPFFQKFAFLLTATIIVFSFVFIIFLGFWAKKIMSEKGEISKKKETIITRIGETNWLVINCTEQKSLDTSEDREQSQIEQIKIGCEPTG